ncbi:MAG TPA: GNAT family N-acetyltransferase [Deinococcales bacterium]|nr:GNAT family N-acetyltransferase [Deinococcales bacterium]
MERHALYPGFRGYLVRDQSGAAVAMVYGTRTAPGQWWHDLVLPQLHEPQALNDCWVLTELAVVPAHQGRRLGGLLHDLVLDGLPFRRATLSTQVSNTRARLFYERRSWRTLVPSMIFSPGGEPFTILGRDIPGRQNP